MSEPAIPAHPCSQCAFYARSVWEPVDESGVTALAHRFSRREVAQGRGVWEQGSPSSGVVCVSRGLIALRSLHADGDSTLLRLAYPGDIIGIRSFLTGRPHQTEARALVASRVCMVSENRASRIVRSHPGVLSRLAIRCIEEIDATHERIIASATLSNKEHLAALLEKLMRAHGRRVGNSNVMRLPLSRSDLADLIGVQPETLSRLIRRLERDNRVRVTGREVRMPVEPQARFRS